MSRAVRAHREASTDALTFDDDGWSTTYEVPSHRLSDLFRDLAKIADWALLEFHPTGIVGRALDKAHVTAARSVVSDPDITSAGAYCEVGVNVGAVEEFDPAFLVSGNSTEVEIDRTAETVKLTESAYGTETVGLKPLSEVRWVNWPECEYSTRARMSGWEFAGALNGVYGATDSGFKLESDLNDLQVRSRDTPWETTLEDVVEKTAFDSSKFSSLFWPDICDRIRTGDDVELRFGDDRPMEVKINERMEYAVAPQITDDEIDGGESA